jgi:hypothetical protein
MQNLLRNKFLLQQLGDPNLQHLLLQIDLQSH